MSLRAFSRSILESQTADERRVTLQRLKEEIATRVGASASQVLDKVIRELNEYGHGLSSWDYDPETGAQTWGPDYTCSPSRGLFLEFEPPDDLDVDWRE